MARHQPAAMPAMHVQAEATQPPLLLQDFLKLRATLQQHCLGQLRRRQ